MRIEEEIEDIDGIEQISSIAGESAGTVLVEIMPDADSRSDVRIRWRYVAMADPYWGIDNVKITGLCRGLSVSDLTRNCVVDMEDVSVFASYWLATDCQVFNAWCCGADMDRSRDVTMTDWAAFSRMDPSPE